ncbi:magnesium and cobalt transport protein CorA [Actinotalea sp. Marseille-Q4924]|uniref:magnesium and cobalt transport protein CorA n=1 Tax=Actinotalea sp. Marseille-Q4924 TaxID=2866571 RepID=UPI001CE3CF6C|nr:magnesium and cobalt transport protein CorA [Actinotalea sp. Marseille-Q4924]
MAHDDDGAPQPRRGESSPRATAQRDLSHDDRPVGTIGDCGVYEHGVRRGGRIPLSEAAAAAAATEGFVWIGLQQPTHQDIADVAVQFDLPPLAVEDAVRAHQRPKLEAYGEVLFAVLKPVRYIDSEEVVEVSEVAIFLGPHFVITVRHGHSDVLTAVRAELDGGAHPLLTDFGPSLVLYRAADLVVDGYERVLEAIGADVDEIEEEVFGAGEDDHAERIYKLKREVAEFRRAVVPLAWPFERLATAAVGHVPDSTAHHFRDIHDHVLRATDQLEAIDRLLTDVLQANTARVATAQSKIALRQNEDMRKISAWAAIALVPTAVAGIYGMNFEHMPELESRYGYFVVLGVIGVICFTLYRAFRHNGWL